MRWIGQGCKSQAHCDIYYCCHAVRREFGCGFAVGRRQLRHLVSGLIPVNERLAKIRIKAKTQNISAHAPTEEKDDTIKDAFYANLEDIYDVLQTTTSTLFSGISTRKSGKKLLLVPLSDSSASTRLCLTVFATARNMVVCSTSFQHVDIHKATWLSADQSICNQIDHVVEIDGRQVSNVLHLRTFRSPFGHCCYGL